MDFTNPHFAEPQWLWLAVVAPLWAWGLGRYAAWRRRTQLAQLLAPHRIADSTRSHSLLRRRCKQFLLQVAVACLGLALARPQWGEQMEATRTLGEDLLFLLDVSRSMLATDVYPNRLSRAKFSILDFVQRHGQGRVGLLIFAGQAFLQCPLTFDYDAFRESLLAVEADSIPVPGTDIGRALEEGFVALEKTERRKLMVLVTDGEDLEKKGIEEANALAEKGVVVFAVGVGSATGSAIPLRTPQGTVELMRDRNGQVVQSRLDEATLSEIAKVTKGTYRPLGTVGEGMMQIRKIVESSTELSNLAPRRRLGTDRFHYPVGALILLLVLESLMGERRRQARVQASAVGTLEPAACLGLLALLLISCLYAPRALGANGDEPKSPRQLYNQGTQKLKAGQLREAETLLQTAIANGPESIQRQALYNLGHARFRQGLELLKEAPAPALSQAQVRQATTTAEAAIEQAKGALADNQLLSLLAAYQNGRGARKQLKAALEAIQHALESHGAVLRRWERASGDFKSAFELHSADEQAKFNGDVVDQHLARLVDQVRAMQEMALAGKNKRDLLSQLLSLIRGRLPKGMVPGDDDEDDEKKPKEPEKGKEEESMKRGKERMMTWEEAIRLLESLRLDANRVVPMVIEKPGEPVKRTGREW